jgi:hypothetical protein
MVLVTLALLGLTAGIAKSISAKNKSKRTRFNSNSSETNYSGTLFRESRPIFSPTKRTETHVIGLGDSLNITQKFHPETDILSPSYSAIFGQKGKYSAISAFPKDDPMHRVSLALPEFDQDRIKALEQAQKQAHEIISERLRLEEKPKTGYGFMAYVDPEIQRFTDNQEAELKKLHDLNERLRIGKTGLPGPGHKVLSESPRWWGTSGALDNDLFMRSHRPVSLPSLNPPMYNRDALIARGYNGG